jgi:hypothetical protein
VQVVKDQRSLEAASTPGLSLRGAGAKRLGNPREAQRRPITGFKFFGWARSPSRPQGAGASPRHGRSGGPRAVRPYEEHEEIKQAIVEAGKDLGLLLAGSKTYSAVAHESAGSRRSCRQSIRARRCRPIASGCPPTASKPPLH